MTAPAEEPAAAEPTGGESAGHPVPVSVRDAVFASPEGDRPAPASRAGAGPAGRVASEFVLAAVFVAGVTHPWWTAGLSEQSRGPARGRRPAADV
jgi:hypothetical protein